MSNDRFEVQGPFFDPKDSGKPNWRVTDKNSDSRIATCYLEENADTVVAALNHVNWCKNE